MMLFSVLTLFPDIIRLYCQTSIIGRAQDKGLITVEAINPREFTTNFHGKVDDSPYGGGSGMVMMCPPLDAAFQSLHPLKTPYRVLLAHPGGRVFDHAYARELTQCEQLVIVCGHYEGIDERIKQVIPLVEEVSVGDVVLTGGELPALMIIDAMSRLIPGVVQKYSSVETDSFYHGLLDYPHYTRPADYKGFSVPEVLLSGNHEAIAQWRREQALLKTLENRPDLLYTTHLTKKDRLFLEQQSFLSSRSDVKE